jgi:hypothetical protein
MKHLTLLIALAFLLAACSPLKPFSFEPVGSEAVCGFPGLSLPMDFSVFAAGAYSGRKLPYQIDQSGHEGTQFDVAVNSPKKPVVLMLGAYEPTIWNIGWSEGTKILALLVSGYHRQAVAGLENGTPVLTSTHDNQGACGYFYITDTNHAPLDPLAERVFGRPVDAVFPALRGRIVVGDPLRPEVKLITSSETVPESFHDKSAPMAGALGLENAVRQGLLRRATTADLDAWANLLTQSAPMRDSQPSAANTQRPLIFNAYVVLKPFTFPSGLYGANAGTFLVPKGVPKPVGNPGHSVIYDFNTLECQGFTCAR